jgi:MSHA pilin protein MshD
MNQRVKSRLVHCGARVSGQGFTLIEAVMSMLIVGLMLVAAMNTVGASRVSQARNAEQSRGPMLAEDLMAEILSQNYQEPNDPVQFGREGGESGGSRDAWDDVDDYDGWSASPPQNKDGTDIPDLDGWGREVKVTWAKAMSPDQQAGSSTGIKRIDVIVTHQGRVVAKLSTLRSDGWPNP